MHPSSNVSRSSFIGHVSKYELTKKVQWRNIFSEIEGFQTGKRQKEGRQIFLALKWKFDPKKGHSKSWSAKFIFRPPKLGAKSPSMVTT